MPYRFPVELIQGSALALLVALVVAACVLVAAHVVEPPSGRGQRLRRLASSGYLAWIYLSAGVAFLLVARVPSIFFDIVYNPDEAQLAAHAMQVCEGAFGWGAMDGGSAGPLLSIFLAWPCLVGWDVSFVTSRFTAAVLLCVITVIAFRVCRRLADEPAATLLTLPLFLFYGAANFFDFVYYSTELLPIALLMGGTLALVEVHRPRPDGCLPRMSWASAGIGFLLLGLVPLAKLQALPIGAVIALALAIRMGALARKGVLPVPAAIGLTLVAAAPTAISLLLTWLQGNLVHFLNSYLLWAADYVQRPLGLKAFFELVGFNEFFRRLFNLLAGALALVLVLRALGEERMNPAHRGLAVFGLALVAALYVSVVAPGRMLFHYLLFAPPFLAVAAAAMLCPSQQPFPFSGRFRKAAYLTASTFVLVMLVPLARSEFAANRAWAREGRFLVTPAQSAPKLISWLNLREEDSMVVWGWMPQLYVRLGLPPATRDVTVRHQIESSPRQAYYRTRWLDDFHTSRPALVVDAVVPGSFAYQDSRTQSILAFAELAQLVKAGFVDIGTPATHPDCPRTYVRSDRWTELERSLVTIASISSTDEMREGALRFGAASLDDRSMMESCNDYWLLPAGALGNATLEFRDREPVAEVMILNTRGGERGTHAAKKLRITALLDGKPVAEAVVSPNAYPLWTTHRLDALANALRVEILEYDGSGGGLNEVKVFRSSRPLKPR